MPNTFLTTLSFRLNFAILGRGGKKNKTIQIVALVCPSAHIMSIYNKGGGVLIVRSDLIGTTPSRCLTPLALRCCPSLGAARRRSAARIQDFELARRRLCPFGSRSPVHSTPKIKGLSSFIFVFLQPYSLPFKNKKQKQKTNSSHLASIS